MSPKNVILSLGSNISPRRTYIMQALRLLNEEMFLVDTSSLYETPPWQTHIKQDNYYNLTALFKDCFLSPVELLKVTQKTEIQLGRLNKNTGLSRTIDIDILFYNSIKYRSHNLTIPHPEWSKRPFVYRLLIECNPSTFLQRQEMAVLEQSLRKDIYPSFKLVLNKENIINNTFHP